MTDRSRLRLVVLGVLVLSLVVTLIGRLWYLQVLAAPKFREQAISNRVRDIVTQPPRGEIVDDMGRPLVTNKTAVVISVDRSQLVQQPNQGRQVLQRLATLLHQPYGALHRHTTPCAYHVSGKTVIGTPRGCYSGSPYQPIPVSQVKPTTAATQRALQIRETPEKYPSVSAQLTAVRHYPMPDGALASSILGYTGPITAQELHQLSANKQAIYRNSSVGVIGLEASYEKYLHGKPGVEKVAVDAHGTVTGTIKDTPPRQGDDIVTNIDAKAQAALEHELQLAIQHSRASGYTADYAAGAIVNVRNGGVVALASEPTYKPNHAPPTLTRRQYSSEEHHNADPFLDKSYQTSNPPGSTFKLISSSGLLADGTASTGGTYDCSSSFDGKTNFEGEVGGEESLHTAIVQSCDTVFYRLANADWNRDNRLVQEHKKPVEGVQRMAHAYGLGENVHLDIPNATEGHIGDRVNTKLFWQENAHKGLDYCKGAQNPTFSAQRRADDKEFCQTGYLFEPGDQMNEDIGQGTVLVSPLQLCLAYAAMANGGTVYEPRIAKAIVSPSGKLIKRIKPVVRDHLPISSYDLDYIRNAMYGVTTESGGTAAGVFGGFPMGQVRVGGKTGTAELTGTNQNGSWFASFGGPAGGKPQYAAVIEVHKAPQGAEGAAPFVKDLWDELYGLQGKPAIFHNGVPPTALPKVGLAAAKQQLARRQARKARLARRRAHRLANPNPSSSTSPPASPPPSSPSTAAAGLTSVLAPDRRPGGVSSGAPP